MNKHKLALLALKSGLHFRSRYRNCNMKIGKLGVQFRNPIAIAAGFDKNGVCVRGLERMGFGYCEIGSVTPFRNNGNENPVIKVDHERKRIVNNMGLPNQGIKNVVKRLQKTKCNFPYGISIAWTSGLNSIYQVCKAIQYACLNANPSYIALNVSCPNAGDPFSSCLSPSTWLRQMKDAAFGTPVLLKLRLTPNKDRLIEYGSWIEVAELDGCIVGNSILIADGGLSGAPCKCPALDNVRAMRQLLPNKVIIGCGGIMTGNDAIEMLDAGADLIQLYSAIILNGFNVLDDIMETLVKMEK